MIVESKNFEREIECLYLILLLRRNERIQIIQINKWDNITDTHTRV